MDALVGGLRRRSEVEAIWIDGSIGRGVADAHSDVDIGVAVAADRLDAFLGELPDLVRAACDLVLVRPMGRLLTIVTTDWQRADIFVRTRDEATAGIAGPVHIVEDGTHCVRVLDAATAPATGRLSEVIEEFLRCVGLLPIVAARDEWVGAYIATGMMTGLLAELMR